jgi:c-di-GMP-binding flagellar brake protein YcgR
MSPNAPRRRTAPRLAITLNLLLLRNDGGRIAGRTLDLGAGGMRIATDRPLSVDEVVRFDLPVDRHNAHGRARVLRMQGPNVYSLRFEQLEEADRRLLSRFVGQTA